MNLVQDRAPVLQKRDEPIKLFAPVEVYPKVTMAFNMNNKPDFLAQRVIDNGADGIHSGPICLKCFTDDFAAK